MDILVQEREKNFIDQNYIEVEGQAELEVSPNRIHLQIGLSDKNNKNKQTLPEIEKKMIDKFLEIGIDIDKDLSLIDYVSNLKEYLLKKSVILTKAYQLIVRDSNTLQKVFFEFQESGISDVSITKLEHSEMKQYRKDIEVSAVKAAKEKAEALAIALNQKIGKAIYVTQQEVDDWSRYAPSSGRTFQRIPRTSHTSKKKAKIVIANYSAMEPANDKINETDEIGIEFEKIKMESRCLVRFALE